MLAHDGDDLGDESEAQPPRVDVELIQGGGAGSQPQQLAGSSRGGRAARTSRSHAKPSKMSISASASSYD